MKILSADKIRAVEKACAGLGLPPAKLMENAGLAAAIEIRRIFSDNVSGKHVLILVGPGNNGGDGLVIARHLHDWGAVVSLYLTDNRPDADPNLAQTQARSIPTFALANDSYLDTLGQELAATELVVDAVFGTGKIRPFTKNLATALNLVSANTTTHRVPVVAIDLPSGMDADTGEAAPAALKANYTVCMAYPKQGHFLFPGAALVGKFIIADIDIPPALTDDIQTELITPQTVKALLPPRPLNANKGTFGRVLAIAGSVNYPGAAFLTSAGALRTGAGLVILAASPPVSAAVAARLAEVTHLPLSGADGESTANATAITDKLGDYNTLLAGCGIGQSHDTRTMLKSILLERNLPSWVLDADALNLLATIPEWWQQIRGEGILTPHPGEMARLCELGVEDIQADRTGIARKMAALWQQNVLLKGAFTIIAAPDGRVTVNPIANPALATAGTGDILAGAVAGFIAQGLAPFEAGVAASYILAAAAEAVSSRLGNAGVIASDLLPLIPKTIYNLKNIT
ncbi:NAD(P)H-hydrate dehydratase [Chloroflexota bacterium]